MISVNALLNQCFQKCSLVGDGQSATGTQAMAALNDLKSVIADLNSQNFVLSDVETVDIIKNGIIRMVAGLPEKWQSVDELPEASATLVGSVYRCGDKVYSCEPVTGIYEFEWRERPDIQWPDLVISPLPDRVVTLSRKLGERFVQILPGDKPLLDSHTKRGLPTFYTCETHMEHVTAANSEYDFEVFQIETDSIQSVQYRITYLKSLPDLKLTDKLYYSEKVLAMIEDGVCAKLCLRYKLLEIKPMFDEEYANAIRHMKRTNNGNRPMTYNFVEGGSYLDSYYDGFSPRSW